ncbi:MAG: ECF-type sigma factor [Pseudomonadota bacterium]|nr:ECF-type sigma factor [Pseudomonadota bacterium]
MAIAAEAATKTLLDAWREGDLASRDRLFELLYSELRQVSAALLRSESNASLSTGDLVHEAVVRLIHLDRIEWTDKAHFLALAARAMRRALIDHARKKKSGKRGHHRVTLVTNIVDGGLQKVELEALDKALIRLHVIDAQKAEIVELRYFGGLSLEDISEVTGASISTIKRQWRVARAWLLDCLNDASRNEHGFA